MSKKETIAENIRVISERIVRDIDEIQESRSRGPYEINITDYVDFVWGAISDFHPSVMFEIIDHYKIRYKLKKLKEGTDENNEILLTIHNLLMVRISQSEDHRYFLSEKAKKYGIC